MAKLFGNILKVADKKQGKIREEDLDCRIGCIVNLTETKISKLGLDFKTNFEN